MLSEQIINSGQIVQLTCRSNYDGKTYYVIGKRFDKKCIYLVESNDVENVSNFDNSFFEIERFEGIDNKANSIEVEGEGQKPIKFGDEIRFKHINSGKYLSVAREYTERSRGAFKILLDEGKKLAEITFQIMPYRTFEKLADPIRYKAKVNIFNQEEEIYLNIEGYSKDQNKMKMKALVGTHMAQSEWEINFYALNYNPTNQVIRDKDLIYMVNSKSSGLLTLQHKDSGTNTHKEQNKGLNKGKIEEMEYDFVLKQLPITYPIKKQPKSFDCIWQISIREGESFTSQMGEKKGSVQLNISFTHLIQEKQLFKNLRTRLVYPQELNNKTLDSKQMRRMSGQTIASGEYIRIGKADNSGLNNSEGNFNLTWLVETTESKKLQAEGSQRTHNRKAKILEFKPQEGDSVVFQIIRIPEDLKKQIYEFIEAKQRIQAFVDNLESQMPREQQAQQQQNDRFTEAQEILKHITESLDTEKNLNQSILQRQMILNDIGFIDIIMECLKKLTDRDKKSGKTDQTSNLRNKFHDILQHCSAGNKEIKSTLSEKKLLQLLQLSDIESNDSSDTETLKEIMKDNKYAIENVMNPTVIKKLIKNFYSQPMSISVFSKFIQILRLICKTTEEVIPRNQKVVIQEFLERNNIKDDRCIVSNEETKKGQYKRNLIEFDFKLGDNGEVKIVTPKNQSSSKETFPEVDEEIYFFFKSNIQEASAFLEWMQLISDVCENKNVLGKRFAEEKFGPRIIEAFLKLPKRSGGMLQTGDFSLVFDGSDSSNERKVRFVLQGYIVRLINNAYIKTIYRKKRIFDRIFIFNKSKDTERKNCFQICRNQVIPTEKQFIQKVNEFIKDYIKLLQGYLQLPANEINPPQNTVKVMSEEELRMDQTVRNVFMLLKNMITYGLYPDPKPEDQFSKNGLIDDLLCVLKLSNRDIIYKPEILEIINFYMNFDLRERVESTILDIKRIIKSSEGMKKADIVKAVQKQIRRSRPSRISSENIKQFIQIMLEFIEKQKVKEKGIFILSLNTLSKFIEVERIFRIRVKETLVIDNHERNQKIAEFIKEARDFFQVCEIKDLKGVSLKDQYELNVPIWDKKGDSIIRFILKITEYMKSEGQSIDENEKFTNIYNSAGNDECLLSAYTECEQPNAKIQKMVKEMKLHRYFYSFIKQFNSEVKEPLSKKLLQIIYLCLAVFAWKNYQNKNELSQLLPYMMQHAENNNGSIEALKQFFSENPSILYDEQKITRVIETITNYIYVKTNFIDNKSLYNFQYAAKLLDFLHSLISADGNKQGRNRILVLSYILDKDRLQITKPNIIATISNSSSFDVKHNETAQITYISVLFGLLAQLVDQESINIAKCKKLHKLQVLVDIMQKVKDVRLKASTRDYVNKLYYISMDNSYVESILNVELDTFIYDLNDYIIYRTKDSDSKGSEQVKSENRVNFKMTGSYIISPDKVDESKKSQESNLYANPVKYTYKNTYYYLNLEKILDSLALIGQHALFESELKKMEPSMNNSSGEKTYKSTIKKITELYERLRFICINYFYDNAYIKKKFRVVLSYFEKGIYQFDFIKREFLNNSLPKIVNFKEFLDVADKGNQMIGDKEVDHYQQEDHSICSKILSNTEIKIVNEKVDQKDKRWALDKTISFLTENEREGSGMGARYETKTSIKKILKSMFKMKKSDTNKVPSFTETYREILNEIPQEDTIEKKPKQHKIQKENIERDYSEFSEEDRRRVDGFTLAGVKYNSVNPEEVFKCINTMISENYEIFQPKNLTFYFRTLSHTISNLDERELKDSSDHFLITLSESFSELMFKTITSCNLQQNIEVSYWFFKFVAEYWDAIKQEKTQPEKLYKLIRDDSKNDFLVKLNDFVVFLSNDIYRKVTYPESSRQSPLRIFDLKEECFKEIKSSEYGYLNRKVENSHIFDTFKNIFQFMQLLCENNFVEFKTELREQKIEKSIKTNNRNLLIRSTIQLRKLFRMYDETIQDIPEKILDFLNEIAQIPCYDNQIELSKSTFFQDVCQFISDLIEKKTLTTPLYCYVENIIERFFKILLSLLESNMTQIYSSFVQKLDPKFFEFVIKIHTDNPSYNPKELEDNESKISKLKINMLIIQKQLEAKIPEDTKLLPKLQTITNNDGDSRYSINNIESIEVRLDDKEHKLYFFKPAEAEGIDNTNQFIQTIEEKLNRSTHLQKLDSLLSQRKNIERYMVYQNYLRNSSYWIILNFLSFNNISNGVSLLINIILMMTTSISIMGDHVNSYESWRVLLPLQIIQFILGTLYFFSDAINHIMKTKLDKYNQKLHNKKGKPQEKFSELQIYEWITVCKEISSSIIYYFICILGLFVSPYYYSIHLLYLFAKIKVLENVFKAIVNNIYQLMYLALLGIAFFVVFSILSINTYAPYAEQQYCNSIYQCFLVIYNKDIFMEESEYSQTHLISLFFEVLYSVFFGALFGNIISGLMTDTFAELRDKENEIAQDQNNYCYICGCSRFEIERENKEKQKLSDIYENHKAKHNKWSYIFYLYELQKKDKTEYTGLEYIISKRVEKDSVVWFPIKKTEENADINEIREELTKLEDML